MIRMIRTMPMKDKWSEVKWSHLKSSLELFNVWDINQNKKSIIKGSGIRGIKAQSAQRRHSFRSWLESETWDAFPILAEKKTLSREEHKSKAFGLVLLFRCNLEIISSVSSSSVSDS